MTTGRLDYWKREQIVRAMLKHAHGPTLRVLISARAAFAFRVYEDLYDPPTLAKMMALPTGWLPNALKITVQFGSGSGVEELLFNGDVLYGDVIKVREERLSDVRRRMLDKHDGSVAKVYEPLHPMSEAHSALRGEKADLEAKVKTSERQIMVVLKQFRTAKALVAEWPESEPFLSQYFGDQPVQLPALPTRMLNEMLDLPVIGTTVQ